MGCSAEKTCSCVSACIAFTVRFSGTTLTALYESITYSVVVVLELPHVLGQVLQCLTKGESMKNLSRTYISACLCFNTNFQELLKPSASSSDPLPFKLLPKLVKTANGTSTCSINMVSDAAATAAVSSR